MHAFYLVCNMRAFHLVCTMLKKIKGKCKNAIGIEVNLKLKKCFKYLIFTNICNFVASTNLNFFINKGFRYMRYRLHKYTLKRNQELEKNLETKKS